MALSAQRRVLMLVENTAYSQDRRIRGEAQALLSAGYQVSVICQTRAGQPWRENVEGVFVHRYPPPRGGRGMIGYAWE